MRRRPSSATNADMETLLRTLLIMLVIYLAGGLLLYGFQRALLYFPRGYAEVPGLEEVKLQHDGIQLHGYIGNPGQPHLLLYFGGNAEQIARGIADLAPQLPQTTIIGFDYRGYGKSEGRPREQALYQDALAQYDRFAKDYDTVSALGRSLGTGVATYLATHRELDALVLVTPVDSVARIATQRFRIYPVEWMLKDHFDSFSRAASITAPVLMLNAAEDTLVDPRYLRRFRDQFASDTAHIVTLEDVGHNTVQNAPEFGVSIRQFLHSHRS